MPFNSVIGFGNHSIELTYDSLNYLQPFYFFVNCTCENNFCVEDNSKFCDYGTTTGIGSTTTNSVTTGNAGNLSFYYLLFNF